MTDINNNYLPPPGHPGTKTAKPFVCFPTIHELGKNIPPPGRTPMGSSTDLLLSGDDEEVHRASSPETESSHSSGTSRTDISTEPVNVIPVFKPVLVIPKSEKKTLLIKDSNSNLIQLGDAEHASSRSFRKSPPSPPATPGAEQVENELSVWGAIGKTLTPLVADRRKPRFSTKLKRPRRPYVLASETECSTRTGTVKSSGSVTSSRGTSGIWSVGPAQAKQDNMFDINNNIYAKTSYPSTLDLKSLTVAKFTPRQASTFRSRSASARVQRNTYPQLKSVLQELKNTEVVFDKYATINALKARVLRGDNVTHEEIKAIRNMTLPPHQRHMGWRLPWSKDLCCIKGLVHIPTPNKPAPRNNTFGTVDELRLPTDQITEEHWGRRQYVLNLAGFHDDDISLYLEGKNRLVIRAIKPDERNERYPAITVTETIVLPPDLPADNLRIVRKPSGTTIIEESWRF